MLLLWWTWSYVSEIILVTLARKIASCDIGTGIFIPCFALNSSIRFDHWKFKLAYDGRVGRGLRTIMMKTHETFVEIYSHWSRAPSDLLVMNGGLERREVGRMTISYKDTIDWQVTRRRMNMVHY